jgi:hypothetical protein
MSAGAGYQLVAGPDFDLDYHRIDAAASRDRSGPAAALRRQVLRTMLDLASAKTDGHHALSWTPGAGDLRDCVTVHIRSDPHQPADYRLVFREIARTTPDGLARRELLAIKPRRGPNNIYAHVCARLKRHPNDRQPGLGRFDDWQDVSDGVAGPQAELDAKRAIAHAWEGQQPLRSSRPIIVGAPGAAMHVAADRAVLQHRPATTASEPSGYPQTAPGLPRASGTDGRVRPSRSGATGWPGRE